MTGIIIAITSMAGVSATFGQEADHASGKPLLEVRAVGAQIYQCKETDSDGLKWMLREPIATLVDGGRTIGTHSRGPTWKIEDGSSVEGRVLSASTGHSTGNIPESHLAITRNNGRGRLAKATMIERINTNGGMPPSSCSVAGALLAVPYTATYIFRQ
ncbi:DUF3455 domain-containing protein [Gluconacetobacter dulcium]|nr:DUF3455 domain-containing protein [Gluconacetobacter dulcium]